MKKKIILLMTIIFVCVNSFAISYAEDKTLTINKKDGQLYYETIQGNDVFLFADKMANQTIYQDTLSIFNETDQQYKLYLQMAILDNQSDVAKALLSNIHLKISMGNDVLYDGKADGIISNQSNNLDNSIFIGNYTSGMVNTLMVEYQLVGDEITVRNTHYYIKSEYQKWENSSFDASKEPTGYDTQQEALTAAHDKNESDVIFIDKSSIAPVDTKNLKVVEAKTQWQFLAVTDTENPDKPVDPSNPDTPVIPEDKTDDVIIETINPSPNTGDTMQIKIMTALATGILALIGLLAIFRKRLQKAMNH